MRGRRPSGPEYVQGMPGSELARQRAQVVLETITGACRFNEACARLRVSEPRLHQLRLRFLLYGLAGMEPRAPGRRRRTATPLHEEVRRLQEQVAELQAKLQGAQVREEIALALPRCRKDHAESAAIDNGSEKKTPRPRLGHRARAPASRKNT